MLRHWLWLQSDLGMLCPLVGEMVPDRPRNIAWYGGSVRFADDLIFQLEAVWWHRPYGGASSLLEDVSHVPERNLRITYLVEVRCQWEALPPCKRDYPWTVVCLQFVSRKFSRNWRWWAGWSGEQITPQEKVCCWLLRNQRVLDVPSGPTWCGKPAPAPEGE